MILLKSLKLDKEIMPVVFTIKKVTNKYVNMDKIQIARMCHQTNKAGELNGDNSKRLGRSTTMADSAIKGVEFKPTLMQARRATQCLDG
jgi:23S rRNA maturation-related 3'-5' exoribonuclease YhaM